MKRLIFTFALLAAALSAFAQSNFKPLISLKPDKTVFLYADDPAAAVAAIDDPVYGASLETLKLTPKEDNGITWPEKMVGDLGQIESIGQYSRFDIYFPENPNGQMVVMCPGGGYKVVCTYGEGLYAAEWLLKRGVTVAVVKHRMPNFHWTVPLEDVQEVFRYCRRHAREWKVNKIGVMGYSAGGHLAASASTLYVDQETRPDFSILFYPVISFCIDVEDVERGTRGNLLGYEDYWEKRDGYTSDEYISRCKQYEALKEHYSLERRVDANTPPAFIVLGQNDHTVPAINSLLYYTKLVENGIKSEIHIFDDAKHGFCFFPEGGPDWLDPKVRSAINANLERWLQQID